MLKKWTLLFAFLPFFLFSLDISSKLTIITLLSPNPSTPRTILLELTQFSLNKNIASFQNIPKIIAFNAPKNSKDEALYNQFKEKIKRLTERHPHFQNSQLVFSTNTTDALTLKEALKEVKTEYVLIHQADRQLLEPYDPSNFIEMMDQDFQMKWVQYTDEGSSFPIIRTSSLEKIEQTDLETYLYSGFGSTLRNLDKNSSVW